MEEKLRITNVVTATLRVSNDCDGNRDFDIEANVNIQNGAAVSVTSGNLAKADGSASMSFYKTGDTFQTTFYAIDGENAAQTRVSMLEAGEAFVAEAMAVRLDAPGVQNESDNNNNS